MGLDTRERRARKVDPRTGLAGIREVIVEEVRREKEGAQDVGVGRRARRKLKVSDPPGGGGGGWIYCTYR